MELASSLLVHDFMPKSPKKPSRTSRKRDVDHGVGDKELEDRVGRRPDEKPDMVPPGTTVGRPDEDSDDTRELPDPDAIEADRATARRSDRTDGRDGVDASDTLPQDPDSFSGGSGRRRA